MALVRPESKRSRSWSLESIFLCRSRSRSRSRLKFVDSAALVYTRAFPNYASWGLAGKADGLMSTSARKRWCIFDPRPTFDRVFKLTQTLNWSNIVFFDICIKSACLYLKSQRLYRNWNFSSLFFVQLPRLGHPLRLLFNRKAQLQATHLYYWNESVMPCML